MTIELLASAARTASGNRAFTAPISDDIVAAVFKLKVTAAAAAVGDTLDVYIQHSVGGADWDDFVHFTQVLGNGGAKTFYARWNALGAAPESELGAPQDAALAAGVLQQPVGRDWRVKWVIAGATPDFTFEVTADVYKLALV